MSAGTMGIVTADDSAFRQVCFCWANNSKKLSGNIRFAKNMLISCSATIPIVVRYAVLLHYIAFTDIAQVIWNMYFH